MLALEFEAVSLQSLNDVSIAESHETVHLRSDYDGVISPLRGRRQIWHAFAFAPGLNEFPGHVPCDVERFCNGAALRNKALQFIRCCEKQPFRQFLNANINGQFLNDPMLALFAEATPPPLRPCALPQY